MKVGKFFIVFMSVMLLTGAGCSRVPSDVVVEIDDGETRTQVIEEEVLPVNEEPVEEEAQPEPIEEPAEEVSADPETTPVEELSEKVEEPVVEAPKPQIRTFDVVAKQWEFVPGTITVNEGDTVRMNVTSTDVDHGIAISQFGVNKTVKAGETEQIEFVADKKGTFTIFCSVFCGGGHSSMKGTLIVE